MIENDPFRCGRCRVYVRRDVALSALVVSSVYGRVCRNRVECDTRIDVVASLDRILAKVAA